jgi:hypothetical protein
MVHDGRDFAQYFGPKAQRGLPKYTSLVSCRIEGANGRNSSRD